MIIFSNYYYSNMHSMKDSNVYSVTCHLWAHNKKNIQLHAEKLIKCVCLDVSRQHAVHQGIKTSFCLFGEMYLFYTSTK